MKEGEKTTQMGTKESNNLCSSKRYKEAEAKQRISLTGPNGVLFGFPFSLVARSLRGQPLVMEKGGEMKIGKGF